MWPFRTKSDPVFDKLQELNWSRAAYKKADFILDSILANEPEIEGTEEGGYFISWGGVSLEVHHDGTTDWIDVG
jgi:hypothetical protein